ncbi:hypothetical protein [Chryseosolibacter indicus]|uniref:Sensor of ECF-type sigma factor n=1 Tax=Chryseosolibacter indicus TaxID=2782351 RepID=A0ABS5VKM8_9BACT|nr:hypothetical protein [Chryseosolibacter indicus]MBT1701666.1 hypothetical protein [Chryseosolibacter indicus]
MKALLKIFLLALLAIPVLGQNTEEDLQEDHAPVDVNVREKIRAAHIAYITDKVSLTPEQAEKFWPLYNEFTDKRRSIFRKIRNNPADNLELRQQALDLEKQYSARFLKVITEQQLIELRHAEADFKRLLLKRIQQGQTPARRQRNNR